MLFLTSKTREHGLNAGMEQGIEQGMQKGIAHGMEETKINIAKNLLDLLDNETISLKTGLGI